MIRRKPPTTATPATKKSTAKSAKETESKISKLDELINVVTKTANAKGWTAYVAAKDEENNRYATISVKRRAPTGHEEISGVFEITCDKRASIKYHKTSFYGWGLSDLYDAVVNEFWKLPWVNKKEDSSQKQYENTTVLVPLLKRFHAIARQLKHRYNDRETITINDEYDVQDVLHAMLRGLFDDVRAEEYSPSYAGGASRLDFLLKAEQIVIEVKMANTKLRDKQIGEQLIIDIKRYQQHPDCKRLICFVYDPDGFIKNPVGLENDLSGIHEKLEVKTIIVSV